MLQKSAEKITRVKMTMKNELCKLFIGIDPGVSGALAAVRVNDEDESTSFYQLVEAIDMPFETTKTRKRVSPHAVNLWIEHVIELCAPCKVFLTCEAVHSMPRDGAMGAFSFGDAFGVVRGVLCTKLFQYEYVSPQKWKRYFGLTGADKDYSRTIALQRINNAELKFKKDHNKAEAMLLAVYGAEKLIK